MKIAAMSAILGASLLASASQASAEVNYPWCIITGGESEGVMSCGYVSLAQCMQTRVGTDMCVPNPRYQPGTSPARPRPRGAVPR
jgi:hypothetical protein